MGGFFGRALLLAFLVAGCGQRSQPAVAIPAPPSAPVNPIASQQQVEGPEKGAAEPERAEAEETDEMPLGPEGDDAPPASGDRRGWLGVELEAVGRGEVGVRVGRVVPKSPAEAAGLVAGDVIQSIDGEAVAAPGAVVARVSTSGAGARLGFALRRGTADRLIAVTLGAFPERDALYRMSFVDRPAPAFESLATAKGSLAPTLLAQRGQVVVIEFWAPWCMACRALIPHMNQWHAQYAARGVRVIGITGDSVPRALSSATQLGMEYPILSDATGRTTRAYQASAIPALFVIDRAGTVRDVMVGYDAARLPKMDALIQRLVAEGGPGASPTAAR